MKRLRIYCLERRARRLLLHYAAAVESLGFNAAEVQRMCPTLHGVARAGKAAAVRAIRLRGGDARHLRTPPRYKGPVKRGPQRPMSCYCPHCGWWYDWPANCHHSEQGCPCRKLSPQHRELERRLLAVITLESRARLGKELLDE